MRRTSILLAASIVLGLTAVALLGLAFFQRPVAFGAGLEPGANAALGAANGEAVVRRFYEAVNAAIATGDPAAVRAVVAPDLVEHQPVSAARAGRDGLEEYLAALHASSPDLRLTVEAVVAAGDRAIARVAVGEVDGPGFLGDALAERPASWGPVDVFRVAGGQIVERWGFTDGLVLPRPAHEATFDVPVVTRRALSVERLTFAPGVRTEAETGRGPIVLQAEVGELVVKPEPVSSASPTLVRSELAEAAGTAEPIEPGAAVRLAAGASLALPEGTRYAVWNDGREPARLVAVSVVVHIPWSGERASRPPTSPPGLTVETLASGSAVPVSAGPAAVALGRATLAPGGRLALPALGGPAAVVVQAGSVRLATDKAAWVRERADGSIMTKDEAVLGAADSAYLFPAMPLTLWNAGEEPAEVLVVALRLPPADEPLPEPASSGGSFSP